MKKKIFVKTMLMGLFIFVPLSVFSVFFLNPKMGNVAIITLLVSIFFSLVCLVALLGFVARVHHSNNEQLYNAVKVSLRQGFWVGLYVLGMLGLGATNLLTWWDGVLLALSLILFEIYFKSSKEIRS